MPQPRPSRCSALTVNQRVHASKASDRLFPEDLLLVPITLPVKSLPHADSLRIKTASAAPMLLRDYKRLFGQESRDCEYQLRRSAPELPTSIEVIVDLFQHRVQLEP